MVQYLSEVLHIADDLIGNIVLTVYVKNEKSSIPVSIKRTLENGNQ